VVNAPRTAHAGLQALHREVERRHDRLDLTAIGPAVNLEGLASELGKPLVVSDELARLTTRGAEDLGTFNLKVRACARPRPCPSRLSAT
jgi:class 3 adenylate cyclase